MKRIFSGALITLSAILSFGFLLISCSGETQQQKEMKEQNLGTQMESSVSNLPNYRYVDLDTVLSKYNLAKDYNEEMLRMQTNMESEVKRHENSLQSFANNMQNKLQNNGYLSEASYKADQDQINNMQANAQRAVATLQNNFETAAIQAQKNVNDSIDAFIKDYNAKKGYDAIFFKAATLYINPALDITSEVVEGLNARYNKVK